MTQSILVYELVPESTNFYVFTDPTPGDCGVTVEASDHEITIDYSDDETAEDDK